MASSEQLSHWFKCISLALSLSKHEVVEIFRLGGVEISATRAENMRRKSGDPRGRTDISEAEFGAFTEGLVQWMRINKDND